MKELVGSKVKEAKLNTREMQNLVELLGMEPCVGRLVDEAVARRAAREEVLDRAAADSRLNRRIYAAGEREREKRKRRRGMSEKDKIQ